MIDPNAAPNQVELYLTIASWVIAIIIAAFVFWVVWTITTMPAAHGSYWNETITCIAPQIEHCDPNGKG